MLYSNQCGHNLKGFMEEIAKMKCTRMMYSSYINGERLAQFRKYPKTVVADVAYDYFEN